MLRAGNVGDAVLGPAPGFVLRVDGVELTRDELRSRVEAAAGGLRELGVDRGTMVSLGAGNSLAWITAYLAAMHLGAVLHSFNPTYKADEFEFYMSDVKARALVVEQGSTSPAVAVAQKLGISIVTLHPEHDKGAGLFRLSATKNRYFGPEVVPTGRVTFVVTV